MIEMWSRSNWCERAILISSCLLALTLFLDAFLQNSLGSLWFVAYAALIVLVSVWLGCREIQHLLNLNGPSKRTSDILFKKCSLTNCAITMFSKILPPPKTEASSTPPSEFDVSDSPDVGVVSSAIERKYVWSWYSQYVSEEIAFPFACKELLDRTVARAFQISSNMNIVDLTSDLLGVLLRHCKEYKKASKRCEKIVKGKPEDYYRNSHPTSVRRNSGATAKGKSTQSHCLAVAEVLLKELLPWELWDTPHATLLASILAKRLNCFTNDCLSDPVRLRCKLKKMFSENPKAPTEKFDSANGETDNSSLGLQIITNDDLILPKESIKSENFHHKSISPDIATIMIETTSVNTISDEEARMDTDVALESSVRSVHRLSPLRDYRERKTQLDKKMTQPIDISNAASRGRSEFVCVSDSRTGPTNEVKIYDRVVEGSVKTWNTDVDLECVSLGRDLLASLDGDIGFESRLGRLWESDAPDAGEILSPNPSSAESTSKIQHRLWFGEEDNLDAELTEESPPKNMVHTNTISYANFNITKPLGIQNMKELQSISKNTVNQAKNKIGDLQDEAAGVMEGIIDLGIAGLRKGLRLTGLQDSAQDRAQTAVPTKGIENQSINLTTTLSQVLVNSRKNSQSDELAFKLDIPKNISSSKNDVENGKNQFSSQPVHLIKQQKVSSQDSISLLTSSVEKASHMPIPPSYPIFDGDSPDYEYEEAEDLPSTIAKLRCLLQQKTADITLAPAEDALLTDTNVTKKKSLNVINSPVHQQTRGHGIEVKFDDASLTPSIESDSDFIILNRVNSMDFTEAEDALNHKSLQIGMNPNMPQGNNIPRFDKLFTRTVTGVFNSFKTAVGGDNTSDALSTNSELSVGNSDKQTFSKQHPLKGNWMYIEGDMDLSLLIGHLLVERRGYCVVEAAQDSLDMISGNYCNIPYTTTTQDNENSTIVQDELDEADAISQCPLWHMCMELIAVLLEGSIQKDAVVKFIDMTSGDTIEHFLQGNLFKFGTWIRTKIIDNFRELLKDTTEGNNSSESEVDRKNIEHNELCEIILEKIPGIFLNLFGKEQISEALKIILLSIDHQLINRDVVYNMLDVLVLHFLKACASRSSGYLGTPPPSA